MLDPIWNQGSGLSWQAGSPELRVLSVIPSGEAADLQALWLACVYLQQQGYPVVVLDGTERESPESPGLQDLLQPGIGCSTVPADLRHPQAIASLPAACGMVQLAHAANAQGQEPLQLLHRHLRNHALVVLVAPAPLLSPLLAGSHSAPLLLVPSQRSGVLGCYRALKHVFMHTGLMPRLLALRPEASGIDPLLKSVAMCSLHHLHTEPLAQQIDPDNARQLQRWSLQCLEYAELLHSAHAPVLSANSTHHSPTAPHAWNH